MLKEAISSALANCGYTLSRKRPSIGKPFDVLPYLLAEQASRDSHFNFIQIGANDGIHNDPLHQWITEFKMPGILVEPLPDKFQQLKANYSEASNLNFENAAVVATDGNIKMYRVIEDGNGYRHQVHSLEREHIVKHGISPGSIEEITVPGITFESLLRKYRVEDVGLLQVDVEGYDGEIIKMALQSGVRPKIINFENCWLGSSGRHECRCLLERNSYLFLDIGRDTLAIRGDLETLGNPASARTRSRSGK